MNVHAVLAHMERHVRRMEKVVREILFDHVALVAEADDEVVESLVAVDLHHVPQHRTAADLDHRFRPHAGLFGDARPQSAGQDDDLHGCPTCSVLLPRASPAGSDLPCACMSELGGTPSAAVSAKLIRSRSNTIGFSRTWP